MSDYLSGFYVGLATATVLELSAILGVSRLIRARNSKPRALHTCKTCDAEVDESGVARDALFKLYVCPSCGDTTPQRFARSEAVAVSELVVPVEQAYRGAP